MELHQVEPWEQWPSGDSRPLVVLPFELSELAYRFGLKYQRGIDDLDTYCIAALELANGEQAWVIKHDNDSNPGTVVYVDANSDVDEAQALLLSTLGIKQRDLLWQAPAETSLRTENSG